MKQVKFDQKLGIKTLVSAGIVTGLFSCVFPNFAYGQVPPSEENKISVICVPNITTGAVKCEYGNGDRYIGNFVDGLPEGNGIYIYSSGDRYEGELRQGLPNGDGTFISKDDTRVTGLFENGVIKSGTVITKEGDRYIGSFSLEGKVGQPSGKGQLIFANGDRFEGQFLEGRPLGEGVFTRIDGTRCQGQFFNENFDAKGNCTFPNGYRYQGELRGGIPHGVGTMIDSKGKRFSGNFVAGQRVDVKK